MHDDESSETRELETPTSNRKPRLPKMLYSLTVEASRARDIGNWPQN